MFEALAEFFKMLGQLLGAVDSDKIEPKPSPADVKKEAEEAWTKAINDKFPN